MHTNVYDSFCVYAWEVWVFDHFTNKYSSFQYVDRESDAFDKLIEFKAESDNLLGKHVKVLRLDRGSMSSRFDSFHMEYEMMSQLCSPETPLNGVVEIRYQTLMHMVRSMIGFSLLPIFFGDIS